MTQLTGLRRVLAGWSRLIALGLMVWAATLAPSMVPSVRAEGTRELLTNGGKRALTEFRDTKTAGLYRRTWLRVYAKAGETILLGSSGVNLGSGDIWLWKPNRITDSQMPTASIPAADLACRSAQSGKGVMTTRAQELAGPQPNAGGYTPCIYTAPEAGVYWVAMIGPQGSTGTTDGTAGTIDAPNVTTAQNAGVSMWDITVRDSGGATKAGRVFVDYLAMLAGGNGPLSCTVTSGYCQFSTLYAVSSDGFKYQLDLRGLDPNGYILYGNSVGFLDPDGKTPLYHDLVATDNTLGTIVGGVKQSPATAKLFFSTPNADLPTTIVPTPQIPTIANVTFSGSAGGTAATYTVGGQFTYTGNVGGIAEIVISRNGTDFDPTLSTNRVLRAVTAFGSSVINWDGKDNSGAAFPVGGPYSYRASMHAGEYHFPLLDAENSANGGPTLTLLNPIGGTCPYVLGCSTAFYDDRSYRTTTGVLVNPSANPSGNTPPNPLYANPATGFNSSTNQRKWGDGSSSGFGNWKGLDLWTYFPSQAVPGTLTVVAGVSQDLRIQKSHTGAFPVNGQGSYTLRVANAGTSAISGAVTVVDTLPAGLTYASFTGTGWSCSASGQTVTCSATASSLAAGAALNDITLTVNVGQIATANVTNTATVSIASDQNAGNNTATDPTVLDSADLAVTKSVSPPTATVPGQSVTFSVQVTNNGPSTATGVQVTDLLPAGLTYGSYTASQGVYVAGTGVWSVGSMPSGSNATLSIVATVDSISCGTIVNTASRTASSLYDYASGNDSGSATLTLFNAVSLSGVVTEAGTGVALVGATVVLVDSASHTFSTTTGAGGAYSFPGTPSTIASGSASVTVSKANYADTTLSTSLAACGPSTLGVALGTANLLVTKSDGKTTTTADELLNYTVTVQNIGSITAEGVQIVDTLDRTVLTYLSDTSGQTPAKVDNPDNTTTRTYTLGSLAPNASFSFIVHTQVKNPLPDGTTAVWNKANASTTSLEADVTNNEFTDTDKVATAPDLKITNDDGRTTVQQGQTGVTYNLTYGNVGNVGATGVTVTDVLDPDVTFTGCSGGTSCSYDAATRTVTWQVGSVLVGGTGSLSVTVNVSSSAAAGGVIAANATINDDSSHGVDPNLSNNTAPESDVVVAPQIVLEKTATSSSTPPNWDGQVTYTLKWTNTSGTEASSVVISDPLLAGTTFVSVNSTSATCVASSGTVTCTVGTLAAGASGSATVVVTVQTQTTTTSASAATLTMESSAGSVVVTTSTADPNLLAKWTESHPTMTAGWNANPRAASFVETGWAQPGAGFGEAHWTDASRIDAQWVATTTTGQMYGNYTFFRQKFCLPLNATGLTASLDVANDDYGDQYLNQVFLRTKVGAGTIETYNAGSGIQAGGNLYGVRLLNNTHGGHAQYDYKDHPGLAARVTASYTGLAPFAAAPAMTMAGNQIPFTMAPSFLGGIMPFEYQVDFGDGTAPQAWTLATTINHTYAAAGSYTAVVTARDAWGCTAADQVPVTVLPVGRNLLANTASVGYQNSYGVSYSGSAATGIPLLSQVDLGITKTSSPHPAYAGEPIVYTLHVTNNGDNSLGQVTLTDALPAAVQGVVYEASKGTFDPVTGLWTGTLGKSDSFDLTITGMVDRMAATGTLNNTAAVSPVGGSDSNSVNNSAADANQINRRADLGVAIAATPTQYRPGDSQTFIVTVTNYGSSSLTEFLLSLALPTLQNVTYAPSAGAFNSTTGQWTGLVFGSVEELTLTIVGTVPAGTTGPLTASATVTTPTNVTDAVSTNNSAAATINSQPAAITLAEFSAVQQGNYVLLTWETASELSNRGFNLYRGTSSAGPDRRLNELLIPSQSQGNPGGFTYTWEDHADLVPGTSYFYWVEDVDVNNVATRHGPVSVDFIVPTAVTLNGVQASPAAAGSALPLAGTMLALLAPLAGALVVRRRRA